MSHQPGQLSEFSLYVGNLAASTAFYRRLFGLDILLEDRSMVGLQLPGSAVLLLRGRQSDDADAGPRVDHDGTRHVRLPVSVASLPDWERHLMLSGVVVEGRVVQADGSISLYFRDLDGHSLELATPGTWTN